MFTFGRCLWFLIVSCFCFYEITYSATTNKTIRNGIQGRIAGPDFRLRKTKKGGPLQGLPSVATFTFFLEHQLALELDDASRRQARGERSVRTGRRSRRAGNLAERATVPEIESGLVKFG